jgi:hypothetical protein
MRKVKRAKPNRVQLAVLALDRLTVRDVQVDANEEATTVRMRRLYWALQSLREMRSALTHCRRYGR